MRFINIHCLNFFLFGNTLSHKNKENIMNKKYCRWNTKEIKALFSHIEQCNIKGMTLTKAFESYAILSRRKPNSVRNYYYAELNNLQKHEQQRKNLEIDLTRHEKTNPNFFSKNETTQIMQEINDLISKGFSVRKACLTLGGGDISKMVRLQNKYRTVKKEQETKNAPLPHNIISMPQKQAQLTENEINSLFLGLVKLIKSSMKQELNLKMQKDTENANSLLRQTLVNLSNKEHQIEKLKKSFELLKLENKKLDEKIKLLRVNSVDKKTQKLDDLKNYTKKYHDKRSEASQTR